MIKYLPLLRSIFLVVLGVAALVFGLFVCSWYPAVAAQYPSFVGGVVTLVAIGVTKSAVEHLANGGGVFGALKVLFTDTKPPTAAQQEVK